MREELQLLLTELNLEIEKASASAELSREIAADMSKIAAGSPSSSGDRIHSVNKAMLSESTLRKLELFKREIEDTIMHAAPDEVEPVCVVVIKYDGDNMHEEIFLANNAVNIKNHTIISPKSPLGQAIVNKRPGDNFKYVLPGRGKTINGSIVKIK